MRVALLLVLLLAGCAAPPPASPRPASTAPTSSAAAPTSRTRTAREIAASVAAEADVLFRELRYAEAFPLYEQANALDPDDREIARRHDSCVFVAARLVHPLAADHRRAREAVVAGKRRFQELDFGAAHQAFAAAVAADPENDEAQRELARTTFVLGERTSAIRFRPGHGPTLAVHADLVSARALLDAGRRDEARARVARVRETLRWWPYEARAFRTRADELYLETLRSP